LTPVDLLAFLAAGAVLVVVHRGVVVVVVADDVVFGVVHVEQLVVVVDGAVAGSRLRNVDAETMVT
jgi:hypothetical protein